MARPDPASKFPLLRFSAAFLLLCAALSGCGDLPRTDSVPVSGSAMKGQVIGGLQPVRGAMLQLYAASSLGFAAPATPLLSTRVTTDASGSFSITGAYSCPSASSLVYLVVTGGNPGLAANQTNANLALMAGLGPCGDLTPATFLRVNEVTTVASILPLAPFAASYSALGSAPTEQQTLADAFQRVRQLVDLSTGSASAAQVPPGYTSPSTLINTLADVIATCVNSSGGRAGDGSACGKLFAQVTPANQAVPTDTIGALLDIARAPSANTDSLFALVPSTAPFQPALTAAPPSWALALQADGTNLLPDRQDLLGEYLLQEGSGNTAGDTSGRGNDGTIVGAAWEGSVDLGFTPGNYISLPTALNATNSWQFAIYSPPFGSADYPLPQGAGDRSAFGLNPSLLCGSDRDHTCLIANSLNGPVSQRFYAYNSDNTESAQPLTAGWHIVTLVGGQNGAPDHYYFDGVEQPYNVQSSGAFTHPLTGNYQIGGSGAYTGTWFTGKVAAAWAWSTSLSGSDAQAAAAYARSLLLSKGVSFTFANASYKTPMILGGIDSRATGLQTGVLSLTDPSYSVVNLASRGATLYDYAAMYDALVKPQIAGNTAPTIMIYWGGVNDFSSYPNMPPALTPVALQSLVVKAKADGAKVIVATEISSSVGDSAKGSFNAIVRANALSWGADEIADLATIPQVGADGAFRNSAYFADVIHPNDAGALLIAAVVSNVVNELIGSTAASPHSTAAAAYTEVAGDRFLNLAGTNAQQITLPSCIGYSLPRMITNMGPGWAGVQAQAGETLQGAGSVAPGASARFKPVPGPSSTGLCVWMQE